MKAIAKKSVFIGLTLLGFSQFAKAQFTLDGEIRPRFEHRHGFKSVADSAQKSADFIDQRTRLNFGYKTEGYQFKVVIQDVRVWGSQPQLVSNDGALTTLHEAWGEAFIKKGFSFKFGRQEIIYDDHRIFGNVGWAQQARSHDAGIFKYKTDKFKADLGFAYNQDKAGLVGTEAFNGSYKAFQYLWFNIKPSDVFNASVLFLNNGKQAQTYDSTYAETIYKDNYSQTAGTRLSFTKDKLTIHGEFYKQMGLEGDWANTEIDAMLYGGDISYNITDKFSATAGYQYLSGQSQTDTTVAYNKINHAFNPFYGTNHKFNGFMDYFYVGNHIGSVGLQDIFFKLKYANKDKKYFVGVDVHMFAAAADVFDAKKYADGVADAIANGTNPADVPIEAMDPNLGTEIDFTFGFQLAKGVDLKGGYSQMLATETLAVVKGVTYNWGDKAGHGRVDQSNNWAWLMITLQPKFITGEEAK